ncbi:MAG: polynucleotide adenylyltransferase PcnB [Gammaproteobacteria bacterium]
MRGKTAARIIHAFSFSQHQHASAGQPAGRRLPSKDFVIEPKRIPREAHSISRSQISSAALRTLYTLKDAGFEAYLVGGGVRDLLAGLIPKDFDIATSAHPEQVKPLFRSCRLIGRRFVICHVRFGQEIIEVTTFRGPISDSHERDETGRILSDNEYGTLEEDAFRRDFTINALYYDIRDFSIVDYCGGLEDLQARRVRLIGDPELRYREDPVRMLRAIRIANKLGFALAEDTAGPIPQLAPLLMEVPAARLFDEVLKVLQSPDAVANYEALGELGLFAQLFPETDALAEHDDLADDFIALALAGTAQRMREELPVSPAFLYAALLWPPVWQRCQALMQREGLHANAAILQAGDEILARAVLRVAIPKRFSLPMREIWQLQTRFEVKGARGLRILTHPRFRAAYDFLLLRAACGEVDPALANHWTALQAQAASGSQSGMAVGDDADEDLLSAEEDTTPAEGPQKRRRRRRRGGRGRSAPGPAGA